MVSAIDKIKFSKLLIYFSTITLFFVLLWLLFSSTILANHKLIISLRNYYQFKILNIVFTDKFISKTGLLPQSFAVATKLENGNYSYYFTGKFESIDLSNNVIYLKNNFGKVFRFKMDFEKLGDNSINLTFYEQKGILYSKAQKRTYSIDTKNHDGIYPFQKNDIIRIYWHDTRKLTAIIKSYYINTKENEPSILRTLLN